mmetsp:Transcript_4487/g.12973  ORF Transcript_4487/g.12973 Transcript_4487/m.12973 type:complete len:206 (-) Transcript_4487:2843-3460(-)
MDHARTYNIEDAPLTPQQQILIPNILPPMTPWYWESVSLCQPAGRETARQCRYARHPHDVQPQASPCERLQPPSAHAQPFGLPSPKHLHRAISYHSVSYASGAHCCYPCHAPRDTACHFAYAVAMQHATLPMPEAQGDCLAPGSLSKVTSPAVQKLVSCACAWRRCMHALPWSCWPHWHAVMHGAAACRADKLSQWPGVAHDDRS